MNVVVIEPKVQHYIWGDEVFIPSLLEVDSEGKPWAELWLGTHPAAESTLTDGSFLGSYIKEHASQLLSEKNIERFGTDLPFLLKILAIAKPLSLQVHPSSTQAQRGYEKELALHTTVPRELWNYKDDKQKAEVLYALSRVTAMCAFLPWVTIVENMERIIPTHLPLLLPSAAKTEEEAIKHFFITLNTLSKEEKLSLLEEYKKSLQATGTTKVSKQKKWLTKEEIGLLCLGEYPEDVGSLAPFYLNVLHLKPHDAIFLEPRTLHAYVRGVALELMSNSDNVLRGGLTNKKVDLDELTHTLSFSSLEMELSPQVKDEYNRSIVLAPAEEFVLGVFGQGETVVSQRDSLELLFCTKGSVLVEVEGEKKKIKKGEALIIGATVASYAVSVDGQLFSASIPG